jgi:hypothetical protein
VSGQGGQYGSGALAERGAGRNGSAGSAAERGGLWGLGRDVFLWISPSVKKGPCLNSMRPMGLAHGTTHLKSIRPIPLASHSSHR